MTFSMDLNASPLPEEDEQPYEQQVEVDFAQEEHVESAVATMRRVLHDTHPAFTFWFHLEGS
jgi:mRNA-capping enzyme